ncbi:MAG: dihydrodipicolinate synthase family protein [Desulfobacteraceae bacterium]|jgi:4-hydroxy-2-oxoglutarate aldolase
MAEALSGIFPALTTPFEDGELSVARLRFNIEKFNKVDLAGYLVLGSTGEGILMDEAERLKAIETVRSSAGDRKTIIVGTGAQSTGATVKFTNLAAKAGALYALVVTPFYFKAQMTARSFEAYYREVAEKSKIPVLLYNVPKFTGLELPLEIALALAEHSNVAGLKDSSGNLATLAEILRACPPDFSVLQGSGSVLFPSLALGANGAILALSNMAPAETVEVYKLIKAGEYEKAKEIQLRVIRVNQKIVNSYGVPGIKYALDLLGYFGGEPRSPLKPVTPEIKESIKALLEDAGLL